MSLSTSSIRRRLGPVLLVNHDEQTRAAMRAGLEDDGYSVVEASNGQQALNMVVSRLHDQVSLVITHLQMPVMDGRELIELLHCYFPLTNIPVIVVGDEGDERLEELRYPALIGHVAEPWDKELLLDMVRSCLSTPVFQVVGQEGS